MDRPAYLTPFARPLMVFLAALVAAPIPALADLETYVAKPDPTFAWKVLETKETDRGTVTAIHLVSQTWKEIRWEHDLRVYEPKKNLHPEGMLLFITGGGTGSRAEPKDDDFAFTLAELCGGRVAVLPQVPNQPLLGNLREDALIAETFLRHLKSADDEWPLLFPMAKSAVRAMDALEAWAKENQRPKIEKFVVTGGSKRGWTTWLTAVVDPRVTAIAPLVIDVLNFPAQKKHWYEVYGKPSDQVDEYTNTGLFEEMDKPAGSRLWRMVDPIAYTARLTLPKLIVLGTNDPFWSVDALNLYWDDLKGPKSVVYLPNAGHGLDENRPYALAGIAAVYRLAMRGKALPELSWTHDDLPDGSLRLTVVVPEGVEVKGAKLWSATSPNRDFRPSKWEPTPMTAEPDGHTFRGAVPRPREGNVAIVGDVELELAGLPVHLSTQIRESGGSNPSAAKPEAAEAKLP